MVFWGYKLNKETPIYPLRNVSLKVIFFLFPNGRICDRFLEGSKAVWVGDMGCLFLGKGLPSHHQILQELLCKNA